MKKMIFGLLGVLGLAVSAPSNAVSVTFGTGGVNSYAAQYYYVIDGATIDATITYTLTSINATTAVFSITVVNNSAGPGQNRLMSFGVDVVAPPLATVSDNSSTWDTALGAVLPGFQRVDFCAYAANGCTGGTVGDGLAEGGGSTAFNVTLTTSTSFALLGGGNAITFTSPFPTKWQSVGLKEQSYELDICPPGTPGCRPPLLVPEPGSLALLGLGLLGVGLVRRRAAA